MAGRAGPGTCDTHLCWDSHQLSGLEIPAGTGEGLGKAGDAGGRRRLREGSLTPCCNPQPRHPAGPGVEHHQADPLPERARGRACSLCGAPLGTQPQLQTPVPFPCFGWG